MKRKWLRYFLFLWAGLVLPARAQLQFTNVSNVNLTNLFGITCGGASNSIAGGSNYVFVAVGANSSVVTWTLTNPVSNANQNTNWIQKQVSGASGLYAAAFGGNQFLVTGDGNVVFSSTDAVNWTSNGMMFANSARAQGMAFNNGTFVAVASAPEIAWSTNATATNWEQATINGVSFADSFRGVTAFSPNNFAACGIAGRLAVSSDGGRDWATPYGAIGQPGLFGITSDNRQTLVCVGANGAILTFTNGGTFWASNSWGTSTLNAASYIGTNYLGTNYGFIAVGDNGSVLTSVEGTNWTTINTNVLANANKLNGVMFATSGQFKGIGVLVGDHGTIILAGTPPPPPGDITPAQTNCAGEINLPLVVKLPNTVDFPIGTLVADWSATADFSTLETNISILGGTNSFVPPVVTNNITITNVYYVRTRDIRTGFVNTNYIMVTNIVYEQPTITSNLITSPICNGVSDTIQMGLTGHEPWTVMWSDGAVSNYTASPASRYLSALEVTNVFPSTQTTNTFVITNLTDSYCTAQTNNLFSPSFNPLASNTVSVTVYPRPTATVSGTANNCNGQSATIQAALTGTGPNWTVTWSETWQGGSATFTNTYTTNNATLTLPTNSLPLTNPLPNETTNYTFKIVALTDSSPPGCGALTNDLHSNAVVTVYPRPTAKVVSGTNYICNGQSATIQAALTGTGPWTVTWSETWPGGSATFTNTYPTNIVNVAVLTVPTNSLPLTNSLSNQQTNYTVTITNLTDSSPSGCGALPSDIGGQVKVIVDPVTGPPTNNGNMTSCYNVAVPLSVSVPFGFTADWYSNVTLVASGTNYVPPVPINLGTNSSLTNTYAVFARFIDPNLTNCYSPGTKVSLISLPCTNMITSITLSGTNALISWSGNYVLQSTTNLTPPVTWTTNVFTGATGPNTWTNSTVPPPTNNFFRLYAPTN